MSAEERTTYASTILTSKKPFEATELVRLRLSQAKLLNQSFASFFHEYAEMKKQHSQQLRALIARSEDIRKGLNQDMLDNQVLTRTELAQYNLDPVGQLDQLWRAVIGEVKAEVSTSQRAASAIERDVAHPLKEYTNRDVRWNEARDLHARLSEIASSIEYHQKSNKREDDLEQAFSQWNSEAPYLFEVFEHTDYNRLVMLKDMFLKFQTAVGDSVQDQSHASEQSMSGLLGFEPVNEISRFATDSMRFEFDPKLMSIHTGQVTNPKSRNASSATVVKHDIPKPKQELKEKKSSHKLRSKVGSIFGRKKKDEKVQVSHQDAISESSSVHSAPRTRSRDTFNTTPSSSKPSVYQPPAPPLTTQRSSSTLSMNQMPLTPQNKEKPLPNHPTSKPTTFDSESRPMYTAQETAPAPSALPSMVAAPTGHIMAPSHSVQSSLAPVSENGHPVSHAPAPPPARKAHSERRDIQSALFTDLSQADIQSANDVSRQRHMSMSTLQPQMTGTSMLHSSIFQHADLAAPGFSASVAEVVNAKYVDGSLESSQLIGEVMMRYNGEEVPAGINLKVEGQNIDKIVPNSMFVESSGDSYSVNPQAIHNQALGAMKYSIKNPNTPIAIHPVWRFEEHQASVMLTLKSTKQPVIVEDLIVSVSITGANTTSAMSKPQGSFNKEKKRIIWKFTEPLSLTCEGEQRLIARFITDGVAKESIQGVMAKFTLRNTQVHVKLLSQQVDLTDPFGTAAWASVDTKGTVVAGNYSAFA